MLTLALKIRRRWEALPRSFSAAGLLAQRFLNVGKGFWVDPRLRLINVAHVAGILLLLYLNARINVHIAETLKNYMNAIYASDSAEQMRQVRFFVIALVAITPVQVANMYLQTWLGCRWRNWLSKSLFAGYYANFAWDKLQTRSDIDNPDQRMTDNVGAFCGLSVSLFMSLISSAVNIYMWLGVLWGISSHLTVTVFVWALIGSLVVILLGKALVGLNNKLSLNEANLRFVLQESRREADSIALYQGEEIACEQTAKKMDAVTDNILAIARRNAYVEMFTTPFNGLVPWLAPFFIAPLFAHGVVNFGVIAEASAAVAALYGALTLIVAQFGGIAGYTALIERLGSLKEAFAQYAGSDSGKPGEIEVADGPDIIMDHLTVKSEDGTDSINDLSVVLRKGESLCVLARGSAGTDLVRTLGRIWTAGSGRLQVPARTEMMFLTQTPYLPQMSLRQAIAHPSEGQVDDQEILKALSLAELDSLVKKFGGLDAVQPWNTALTLGERQRLSLARIMYKHPKYCVVQEATSVLEPDVERMFYALLAQAKTTIVSVVSKSDLAKYHKWVLTLPGDGTWKLTPASQFNALKLRVLPSSEPAGNS